MQLLACDDTIVVQVHLLKHSLRGRSTQHGTDRTAWHSTGGSWLDNNTVSHTE